LPKIDGTLTRGEMTEQKVLSGGARNPLRLKAAKWLEKDFRKEVRKLWKPRWIDTYEPTLGTGIGFPDCQLLIDRQLMPVELKIGILEKRAYDRIVLVPSDIRPDQKIWHRNFDRAGGCSIFLAGIKLSDGSFASYAFAGTRGYGAELGLIVGSDCYQINGTDPSPFATNLEAFCRDYRVGHFR
jgi:hypothetical protein